VLFLVFTSRIFGAVNNSWLKANRNTVSDVAKKKAARGRIRFLSDSERDALLKACGESPWPALHTLVLLAISTARVAASSSTCDLAIVLKSAGVPIDHFSDEGGRTLA
jgi:hypothetical protein